MPDLKTNPLLPENSATELAAARTELHRVRRLADAALSSTPDLVYVFDLQHRFTFANRALLAMWGQTWETAIGKNCLELGYEPWHAEMHSREIEQVVATKQPIRGVVAFNGTNGRRLYDYIFTPVLGANGAVEAVAGTTRDVTEQRAAAANDRFLAELARDLAALVDERQIIRHAVKALGEHTGVHRCYFLECLEADNVLKVTENWVRDDAPSLAGAYNIDAFGGPEWWKQYTAGDFTVADIEDHPLIGPAVFANYAAAGVRAYAVQPIRQPGKWTVVLALTENKPRPWTQDELKLIETVGARVWPLVERARAEVALRWARDEAVAASRAKDSFLASLSHELRTPLNPVLLVASEALNNPRLPDDVRADFKMIVENVTLEAKLIDDLLDLTRIAQDKVILEHKIRDVHEIIRKVCAKFESEVKEKKLRFTLRLAAAKAWVLGDEVRLHQVIWNVLRNAVKFTPPGGRIEIATRLLPAHPERLVIEVRDTGIGLSAAEFAGLFKPFTQGEHTQVSGQTRYGGLGLGLAIAKRFVELHDGSITASSPGRNEGATFLVELPVAVSAAAEPASKPDENKAPSGESREGVRALLIEDHQASRAALARLLAMRKIEVVQAETAAEALEAAQKQKFDLIISDIGLPDMDGFALMKQLRASHPYPGIAITGYGMEDDIAKSREAGFATHLTKPIQIAALDRALAQVHELIAQRRQGAAGSSG